MANMPSALCYRIIYTLYRHSGVIGLYTAIRVSLIDLTRYTANRVSCPIILRRYDSSTRYTAIRDTGLYRKMTCLIPPP
jgi:hypothetical protein